MLPHEPILSYDDLRDALDAAGVRVRAVGDALRVTHASRLTPALRDALRVHKARLLAEGALPLWAQVYTAFGGSVYEGTRKISARRIAREMAALTQPDLEIEDTPPARWGVSRCAAENKCPMLDAEESPVLILPLGRTLRSKEGGPPTLTPPELGAGGRSSAAQRQNGQAERLPHEGGGWEGVASPHA